MTKLRIPSLPYLARNWGETPELTKKAILASARGRITWSYKPLYTVMHDVIAHSTSVEQITNSIFRTETRENVRKSLIEPLPLIKECFENLTPDYVHMTLPTSYRINKDLVIPFEPPMIYGVHGEMYLPWFIFWRKNPIVSTRLSLFVTMAEQMMRQIPDSEDAQFRIYDFSIPAKKKKREATIIDANDVRRLSDSELKEALEIYAAGRAMAESEWAHTGDQKPKQPKKSNDHPDLFDL